jgi:hypothetical protein
VAQSLAEELTDERLALEVIWLCTTGPSDAVVDGPM